MKKGACRLSQIENYLSEKGISFISDYPDKGYSIEGYSSLANYRAGTITWIKRQENAGSVCFEEIALIVAQEGIDLPTDRVIYCDNSKAAFFGIVDDLLDPISVRNKVGKFTYIAESVHIGENVVIGSNCVIDGNVSIGDRTYIMDGTVIINNVSIGHDTVIQPLCVIGIDGFGYFEGEDGNKHMIRHHGGVEIGNNVFIGSHTNIARGTLDNTVIEDDVKIAPNTHIGHNNRVDKGATIICSNVYGSCHIGQDAYITACTIENQRTVGDHALVGMGAVVTRDVAPDIVAVGIPAKYLRKRGDHDV